jgi:nitroreductase
MDCLEAIRSRMSARAFLDTPVSQSQLTTLFETARWAPSGGNTQPWRVVVPSQATCQAIGDAIVAQREAGTAPNPDYAYYPNEWTEPYKSRRKACGVALYGALGIAKEDTQARKAQWYRNYYFFGAPVGCFFCVEKTLEKGAWMDTGMFIQSVMIAAKGLGLDTCPQAAMAEYPDIVRTHCQIAPNWAIVCGMAIGYADKAHPINQYRTEREPVKALVQFLD